MKAVVANGHSVQQKPVPYTHGAGERSCSVPGDERNAQGQLLCSCPWTTHFMVSWFPATLSGTMVAVRSWRPNCDASMRRVSWNHRNANSHSSVRGTKWMAPPVRRILNSSIHTIPKSPISFLVISKYTLVRFSAAGSTPQCQAAMWSDYHFPAEGDRALVTDTVVLHPNIECTQGGHQRTVAHQVSDVGDTTHSFHNACCPLSTRPHARMRSPRCSKLWLRKTWAMSLLTMPSVWDRSTYNVFRQGRSPKAVMSPSGEDHSRV